MPFFPFTRGRRTGCRPYANSALALRYIAAKNLTFIVVSSMESGGTPYVDDWLKSGIPDSRAHEIYNSGNNDHAVRIYEWSQSHSVLSQSAVRY